MHLRSRFAQWALVIAGLALAPAEAAAECPTNFGKIGQLQNCENLVSTAPVVSLQNGPWCINGGGSLSYDLINGLVGVRTYSTSHEGFQNWLQVQDVFVIEGPSGAGPVSCSAVFSLNGLYGIGFARLTVASQSDESWLAGPQQLQLKLFLTQAVGQPFVLEMYASGSAAPSRPSEIAGSLGFTALPPGFSLRSCQGYAALPVPTRTLSWGRVKQLYR